MITRGPATRRLVASIMSLGVGSWWASDGKPARADLVYLKDGSMIRGTVDKDNTIMFVSDELKRTIFYNSKVARIEPSDARVNFERFSLVQPLEQHGGGMPAAAIGIESTPWDEKGRRAFRYVNNRQKTVEMRQAINEINPQFVRYRGIDGFWVSQIAISQVPRPVILGLLAKVDQSVEKERSRVASFLIQVGWFDEARAALDAMEKDFPDLRVNLANARESIDESAARDDFERALSCEKAQQPLKARELFRSISVGHPPKDVALEVEDRLRSIEAKGAALRQMANDLRAMADALPDADRELWRLRLAEVLMLIDESPDAAQDRLEAFIKARKAPEDPASPPPTPEARFALAMSGWVIGSEPATDQLKLASAMWAARSAVSSYLLGREVPDRPAKIARDASKPAEDSAKARSVAIARLENLQATDTVDPETVARIIARMRPPLAADRPDPSQNVVVHRVADDENPVPTDYTIFLPPEYHPLRNYPAIVALHDGRGPRSAVDWLASEAGRRGYIVVAPEYNSPGRGKSYRYSTEEHAAVQLSLRDARKRYSIDSDRVFLTGQLVGSEMAWDFGLAHPDLFAGVAPISGFPAKYAYRYRPQVDKLPLYVVMGDLAPASREMVFEQFVKPMIENVDDVTYVEYFRRGLEPIYEVAPAMFDWMGGRKRNPAPKTFEVATARDSDARFYGVVAQEITRGRATPPEAVDAFGKNLRPATIKYRSNLTGNLINISASGINRVDVWVSPRSIDFKRKFEVRVNERSLFKGSAKPDFATLLDDYRARGDREQLYLFRVSSAPASARNR